MVTCVKAGTRMRNSAKTRSNSGMTMTICQIQDRHNASDKTTSKMVMASEAGGFAGDSFICRFQQEFAILVSSVISRNGIPKRSEKIHRTLAAISSGGQSPA